jgi:hypothetical protein
MMDLLTMPDVAAALGVPVNRVAQFVRDGHLVATSVGGGPRGVPALFVQNGVIVKSLPSVITMLRDAQFSDDEIIEWLHRGDESLPGSPIEALRANRGSEVKRRAQVAGY